MIDTAEEYYQLSKLFDKILQHSEASDIIIANVYLHMLRAHPEILKKYDSQNILYRFIRNLRFSAVSMVRVLQSAKKKQLYYTQHKIKQTDVLLISHLDNYKQISCNADPYFGELGNQLLKNGIRSNIVLLNKVKLNNTQSLKAWKKNEIPRFVLGEVLSFNEEVKIYLSQKLAKKQLKVILEQLEFSEEIKANILGYFLSSSTTLRIASQIAEIVRMTKAKFVITTYEGHAWERLVYCYVRKVNPNIKCFGYQHSAVFKHQHAIKRPLEKKYNPDVILTSGKISEDIFNEVKSIGSKIVCMGSYRHSDIRLSKMNKKKCCLVIPEGFVSECLCLFELSFSYAKQHKEQKFIWRLHPLLNFKKLKRHSNIFNNLPRNIFLSENSLDEDIKKCDSVLYRGSTAVVSTINAGLKPIYYQQSVDELSIDPIYQQRRGKEVVQNKRELGLALKKDVNIQERQRLQDYAQDFYMPLDVQALMDAML